jgi:hypothetical protein
MVDEHQPAWQTHRVSRHREFLAVDLTRHKIGDRCQSQTVTGIADANISSIWEASLRAPPGRLIRLQFGIEQATLGNMSPRIIAVSPAGKLAQLAASLGIESVLLSLLTPCRESFVN